MPYLQVDLDALDDFSAVATRTGLSEGDVAIGLLRLWRHCWKNKTAYVTRERLGGFFRGDVDATIMALEVCEFVDRPEGRTDIHVRGAEKRLGIEKAQVEAGKQHSGNLKRGQKSPGPSRVPPGSPSGSPPAPLRVRPGSYIQHPASSIQKKKRRERPLRLRRPLPTQKPCGFCGTTTSPPSCLSVLSSEKSGLLPQGPG
jgi:hypothetical protein